MVTDLEKQGLGMQSGRTKIPFVTVWMVTYNQEDYIEQAVQSIMMQKTSFEFKLFIGEDYSTDSTRAICTALKEKYPNKIELLLQNKNVGAYKNARQVYKACFESGSKYLALLEGDDYWTDPLKLQKQVDYLEANNDYNICFHKIGVLNQENGKINKDTLTREVPETTDIEELAKGNYIHTASVLMRNNFSLPRWFSKSPLGDWTLYMIAVKDKKIRKLDDTMAVYRVHNESLWSFKSEEFRIAKTLRSTQLVLNSKDINIDVKIILKETIEKLNNELPQAPHLLAQLMRKTKKYLNL